MLAYPRFRHRFQKWRLSEKAASTPLKDNYQTEFPQGKKSFLDTTFLVVDCEMSGLNVRHNQLLSIGWVQVKNAKILSASAKHLLAHADKGAGNSTLIHGLHDSNLAGANSIAKVIMVLAQHIDKAVLVFHHAPVDLRFLQAASMENFRSPLLFPYLDTMEIEKRRMHLQGKNGNLRLQSCRDRYGLANVTQHNALADALATAELFIAQARYMGDIKKLKLGDFPLHCS